MKIVIPGGTGQVGGVLERALTASGHEVVVIIRQEPWHQVGRADAGRVGGRDRRRGRRDQPGGPERELPLHDGEPAADDALAGRLGAGRRARPSRRPSEAAARVAADEHGDDLRPPLRRAERRGDRRHRRRRARRARLLGVQRRHRQGLGSGAGQGGHAAHPQGRAAHRDGDEPRPGRRLRLLSALARLGLGGPDRRRAAVRVVDPRATTSSAPSSSSSSEPIDGPGQPRRAEPAAAARLHAERCGAAWRHPGGAARDQVDGRARGVRAADATPSCC